MSERRFIDRDCSLEIVFSDEVVNHLRKNKQAMEDACEHGGQLFGYVDGMAAYVTGITGPRLKDKKSRYRFFPSRREEQREIDRFFGRGLHFLGDWHTHPEKIPSPSTIDLDSVVDSFNKSSHKLQYFLLVIVGNDEKALNLSVSMVSATEVVSLFRR